MISRHDLSCLAHGLLAEKNRSSLNDATLLNVAAASANRHVPVHAPFFLALALVLLGKPPIPSREHDKHLDIPLS